MLRSLRSLGVVAFACAIAAPSLSASSPWDGTWKLNKEKSQATDLTMTLVKSGDKYYWDTDGPGFAFGCDGKEYPSPGGRTISCTETPSGFTTTTKMNGKTVSTAKHELSPDEKTFTFTRAATMPDGSTREETAKATRVGEGSGFAGTWKIAAWDPRVPLTIVYRTSGDSLHAEFSWYGFIWDGKLDGTPAAPKGPSVPKGLTRSVKVESPSKLVWLEILPGHPTEHDEDTLSSDGKSFSEVEWMEDKPNEKVVLVFEKQ
jgi:hypothetical protein